MVEMLSRSLVAAMLALSSLPAVAQDASADRYSLEKSETGFVRLDRQTGTVTLCKEIDGSLTCRMAADERAAYDEDLARLEKRVDLLEKQAAAGVPAASAKEDLPSDAEIDRSIGIMERFMRAFFGLVQEFRRDEEQIPPSKT
jgi:hypothetical protein